MQSIWGVPLACGPLVHLDLYLREVVNGGELEERGDAVREAADEEPVEPRGVVHLRQRGPAVERDRRKRQHRRDSCNSHLNGVKLGAL